MDIYPAIDIINGSVVRLTAGDYGRVRSYAPTPAQAAESFASSGAKFLHIVDLDGARDGVLSNFESIREITSGTGMFVEVGGGIRSEDRIEKYLSAGAGRVILGTAAVKNPKFTARMIKRYGEKIAVGIDTKNGCAAVEGWREVTKEDGFSLCERMRSLGARTVIYTDIEKDGGMGGTNLGLYSRLVSIKGLDIIASGGISSVSDIIALKGMGVSGAIIGKAIYEGALTLEQALQAAKT